MNNRSIPFLYLVRESIFLLGLSYMIFFGATSRGIVEKNTLLISSILLTFLAVSWIWLGRRIHQPLGVPIAVFLLTQLFSAIFGIDPARSLPEVWLIAVSFFLLLFFSGLVSRGWAPELIIKTFLLTGAIVSLFTWLEAAQWYRLWLQSFPGQWIPPVSYRLPAPNMLAVMLNLSLMACLARLIASRSMLARIMLGLYTVSTLALLYLTSSRGGWLGTAAGLGTLFFLNFDFVKRFGSRLRRQFDQHRWFWAGIVLIFLFAAFTAGYLLYRQAVQPTHGPILSARTEFWSSAWRAFQSSPWLGSGPFTFSSFFAQSNSIPPQILFIYAHNVYFDILHGSGIIGFASFLLLSVLLLHRIIRRWKQTSEIMTKAVIAGTLGGLASFAIHGLFDSVHHTEPVCSMTLAMLIGAALGNSSPSSETPAAKKAHSSFPAALSRFLCPLAGILLAAFAWGRLWSLMPFYNAVQAAEQGNWSRAVEEYHRAVLRNPRLAAAHHALGLSLVKLAETDPTNTALYLNDAVSAFQMTIQFAPDFAVYWANLGEAQNRLGDRSGAESSLQEAIRRAPQSALFRLQLGVIYEQDGKAEAAKDEFRTAVNLDRRLSAAFLTRASINSGSPSELLQAALDSNPPVPSATSIGDLEIALKQQPDSPAIYLALGDALLDSNNLNRAEIVLRQAHYIYYGDFLDYLELLELDARLAEAKGDLAAAVSLRTRIQEANDHWGVYGPGSYGMRLLAPYVYRVPGMPLEWLPGY